MSREEKVKFFKDFNNIKIGKICENNNISYSNVLYNSTTEENINIVFEELLQELIHLIVRC